MKLTIAGTVEEIIRDVFVKRIPMTARGQFSVETTSPSEPVAPGLSPQARMRLLDELAAQGKVLPVLPAEALRREAIYDDRT